MFKDLQELVQIQQQESQSELFESLRNKLFWIVFVVIECSWRYFAAFNYLCVCKAFTYQLKSQSNSPYYERLFLQAISGILNQEGHCLDIDKL